jgi:hypothetical protein
VAAILIFREAEMGRHPFRPARLAPILDRLATLRKMTGPEGANMKPPLNPYGILAVRSFCQEWVRS